MNGDNQNTGRGKISSAGYAAFAQQLYNTCIISDPWVEGHERFCLEPVILSSQIYHRLCSAAEAIGRVYEELCELVLAHPEWLDTFFHLTPYQKLMWLSSEGRWHGIARLDLFLLPDGIIQMCEMNSDTPSGEAEAVVPNQLCHPHYPYMKNPNEHFADRFYTIDILFRHYKTDWWGERFPVWSDAEEFPDPEPLDLQLRQVLEAELENRVTVVNPFGAVLTQNKLTMAFCWQKIALFSPESHKSIRLYIPETYRLCDIAANSLSKADWVLKSDYGCEGDEVIAGGLSTSTIRMATLY
ncbi:MAG: hypothetical protein HY731_09595 [Candidatus Tectomicrobia bacterium]|nr:hypothetical protein [Candidatus Tectomicrobia bacterium]